MKLATRISRISVSKTMAVMEAATKLRDQGIDVVDFGTGEPDFPTPDNVKQAGTRDEPSGFRENTAHRRVKETTKTTGSNSPWQRLVTDDLHGGGDTDSGRAS